MDLSTTDAVRIATSAGPFSRQKEETACARGLLAEYTGAEKRERERGALDRAMVEKHVQAMETLDETSYAR